MISAMKQLIIAIAAAVAITGCATPEQKEQKLSVLTEKQSAQKNTLNTAYLSWRKCAWNEIGKYDDGEVDPIYPSKIAASSCAEMYREFINVWRYKTVLEIQIAKTTEPRDYHAEQELKPLLIFLKKKVKRSSFRNKIYEHMVLIRREEVKNQLKENIPEEIINKEINEIHAMIDAAGR